MVVAVGGVATGLYESGRGFEAAADPVSRGLCQSAECLSVAVDRALQGGGTKKTGWGTKLGQCLRHVSGDYR